MRDRLFSYRKLDSQRVDVISDRQLCFLPERQKVRELARLFHVEIVVFAEQPHCEVELIAGSLPLMSAPYELPFKPSGTPLSRGTPANLFTIA